MYRPPAGPIQFKRREPETEELSVAHGPLTADDDVARAAAAVDSALSNAFEKRRSPFKAKAKKGAAQPRKRRRKPVLAVLLCLVIIIVAVLAIPVVRAKALTLLGARSSLTLTVLDAQTNQPLLDVQATTGGQTATSNAAGVITLSSLDLGSRSVTLSKPAFASQIVDVDVQWRSMASASARLTATGKHYDLVAVDSLTSQPIAKANALVGSTKYQANNQGELSVVADSDASSITMSAAGYATTTTVANKLSTTKQVSLNPAVADVYIARAAGVYNVYERAAGDTGGHVLLAGTGLETAQLDLVPNAAASQAALVSTRDNQKDNAGYLLDTLTLVDVHTGKAIAVAHAATVKIIGWSGDRLVYGALKANAAASDKQRYGLYSYDVGSKRQTTLVQANNINDALMIGDRVYYAASNRSSGGTSVFIAINSNGAAKQQVLNSEVSTMNRIDVDQLLLSTTDGWYSYHPSDSKAIKTTGAQTALASRLYIENPFNKAMSARIDTTSSTITVQTGSRTQTLTGVNTAQYPLRWLSPQTLLYRTITSSGVASDYAVGVSGGAAVKLVDVSNANGLTLWHN